LLAGFKSCTAKVDEVHLHPAGSANWLTAVVHMDFVTAEGKPGKEDWRWTAVWEKRGDDWKIVHEHVSAPLGAPEKK
jgi:ketosteroid isomerase-like protein